MNKLALVAAISCLLPTLAYGQTKRPMTFADLQAMKRVSDPQISPSGKWVMFSVTDVSLEKNSKVNHLWVVPLGGIRGQGLGIRETQVTFGDGESNGRFSPDGRMIALTMKDQIFEMPWNEAKGTVGKAIQVTNVDGGADGAIWSPDSKRLMFVASVVPECSDMGDWVKEDACDKAKNEAADKSPVKAMIFDHLLYRHWNAFTGEKRSHVLVVDSADGTHLRDLTPRSAVGDAETPTFSLGGPLGYAWAPDSKEIAYVTNLDKVKATSTNNDVFTLRLDDAGAVAKKVSTAAGSDDGPAYSPDGKWLAWRSQARNGFESDKFRLVEMDRSTGKVEDVLPNLGNWVDEFIFSSPAEGEVGQRSFFYLASPEQGEEPILVGPKPLVRVASIGDKSSPLPPSVPKISFYGGTADGSKISFPPGEYSSIQISPNGRFLVAVRVAVDRPAEIWVHRASSCDRADVGCVMGAIPGEPQGGQLTHLNDGILSQLGLAKLESFWFTGAANTKVQGFIVKPPNFDPAKKYPVKFLMHGGPQTAWGDSWSYRWNWELLAADGYVVIGVNRRGSTGYGQKFVDEVSGDWGGKAFVDLMKGLDYAEAKYTFIDKDRECALGASYGGFMANWVLTHTDRFKCIVTHDGLYNAESAFGSTEELWFNEWEFRPLAASRTQIPSGDDNKKGNDGEVEQGKPAYPWDYFDKPTAENPFRKNSPMLYIKNARTPTLVVHSQKDYRLDVSEGFQLFTALQLRGVPSKMLYFPDEGHWVLKPQNSQLWYETVDDWCDRWLGMGKYKDVGPEKNPMGVARKSAQ